MNDRPQIDPRYDPAFQRGFTGEVQTGQHPHGVVRSQHPQPPQATQTVQPPQETTAESPVQRAQPLVGSSIPPAYTAAAPDERADELEGIAIASDQIADDETPARPLTHNPFLIALTLLGAA